MPNKESKSILPEFFVAFVLPDASRSPTDDEIEDLRLQTVKFWSKQLSEGYSKPFIRLDLNFNRRIFGPREEEDQRGLSDDYNMYIEVSGEAVFNGKFRGLPSGDEVFREMVAGDSMDYLVAFVRGIETANLFATALEVTAKRLKTEAGSPGGTVVCPTFFVAFAIDQEDPEADIPDGALPETMVEDWKEKTHKAMEDNLRKEWPDTFESLDLDTTVADKGSKKPDDRFHLYMENEASVKFSSDPPSEEDVFRILMKSASSDATTYLLSMHDMEGTPFSCVTTVTIQLVGFEMPDVEDLPPPEEDEKEPEEEGEGEEEEGDQEPKEDEFVVLNVPVFLALCVNTEPPAELPKEEELLQFKDLMLRIFYTEIKKELPDLKHIELKNENTRFGAGIPEERHNMCTEYDAELKFHKDDDIPDEERVKEIVMEINLSTILAHVKKLEPLCFKHTTEVTMRQKPREKDEQEAVPDAAFEAAVEAPPLLMPPPPPSPVKEEKKSPPPSPVKESTPPSPVKEEKKAAKPKKPKKSKPKKEEKSPEKPEAAPKPKEKKKKKEKKAPKKEKSRPKEEKPQPELTAPPSPVKKEPDNTDRVQSSDIYLAMKVDHYTKPPTEDQLEQLRKNTHAYFVSQLKKNYKHFESLDLGIALTVYGEEEVSEHAGDQGYDGMNVYVEWVTETSFRTDGAPGSPTKKVVGSTARTSITSGLPTPYEMTRAIVKDADIIKYLLEHVRIIEGSEFTSATAARLQQRVEGKR